MRYGTFFAIIGLAGLAISLFIMSHMSHRTEIVEPTDRSWNAHQVFEYDGCKVYEFSNPKLSGPGQYGYFSKCRPDQPEQVNPNAN